MKLYLFLFIVLTAAELSFTITYYLIMKKMDRVVFLGALLYAGAMIIAFITYEVEKYRKRKKALLESLPGEKERG